MRRSGLSALAVSALFITCAVSAAEPQPAVKRPVAQTVYASAIQTDSPLVRAAKLSLQSRLHPRSHVIIDSNTLVVTRWSDSSPRTTSTAPDAQGRSWASGNSNDAAALAAQEKGVRDQRIAAEAARQSSLRQEQSYMAREGEEPYSEIIDDHVTKRLEAIPDEMKQKPPM